MVSNESRNKESYLSWQSSCVSIAGLLLGIIVSVGFSSNTDSIPASRLLAGVAGGLVLANVLWITGWAGAGILGAGARAASKLKSRLALSLLLASLPLGFFLPVFFYKSDYQYKFWPPSISAAFSARILLVLWFFFLGLWLLMTLPSKPGSSLASWLKSRMPGALSSPVFWLALAGFVWIVISTILTIRARSLFNGFSKDTAMLDQAFWSAREGISFFHSSLAINNPGYSIFGLRANFILLLFFPGYLIWPSSTSIIIMSNVILVFAVFPIYFLSRRLIGEGAAVALGFAYLLQPTVLSQGMIHDVHDLNFLPLLFMLTFLAFHHKKFLPFMLLAVLTALVKEDVTIAIAMFGVYALILRRPWKWVFAPPALAALWLPAALGIVIKLNSSHAVPRAEFFSTLGNSWPEVIKTVFTNPVQVVKVAVGSLRNFGFIYGVFLTLGAGLPILSGAFLLGLPSLVENLLAAPPPSLNSWYLLANVATLFPAIILGMTHLPSRFRSRVQSSLGISAFAAVAVFIMLLNVSAFYVWLKPDLYKTNARSMNAQIIVESLPKNTSVIAPKYMAGDLVRDHYLTDFAMDEEFPWPDPDYIVLDADLKTMIPPSQRTYYDQAEAQAHDPAKYILVKSAGSLSLYRSKFDGAPELQDGGRNLI